ncbi:hypothetical protein [Methylocystis sp.]|uniref:hypothetical protein n=1 Tax=Methylocystis sp. TaxID=1911079 RepID=UPI003D13144E
MQRLVHESKLFGSALRALGASEYRVEVVSSIEKDRNVRAPIITRSGVVGSVDGGVSHTSNNRIICEWKGDGSTVPSVPEEQYWLSTEPVWNDIVKARAQSSTKSIDIY